jgi:hypothetical protein
MKRVNLKCYAVKVLVKPIVLKELRENDKYRGTIIDAISDINLFLKWELAKKHDL